MKMKHYTKRLFSVLVALALLVTTIVGGISTPANAAGTSETREITILHTNDMHGAVENLGYVKNMKERIPNSILVDGGDATQGSSLATYTEGAAIIELMNAAGYDLMAAGNHEFDYGTSVAIANAKIANFNLLSANAIKPDGSLVFASEKNNGKNQVIVVDGVKIGLFGITTTEAAFKTNPAKLEGVTFAGEVEAAREQVAELQAQDVDVIVAITHVGIDGTSDPTSHKIAEQVDGIDVIIDGHSHSQDESIVNNTYIAQTGTKLANVGTITITVDEGNKVVSIQSKLIKMADIKEVYENDTTVKSLYEEKMAALQPILSEKVADLGADVLAFYNGVSGTRTSRLEETPAGSLVADAMLEGGKAILASLGTYAEYPVVALQNGGGVRADIIGTATVGSILDVLPFGNMIAIKEITPDVLYATLENGYGGVGLTSDGYIDVKTAYAPFAQIAGMRVELDYSQTKGSRVLAIYLVNEAGKETKLDRADTNTKIAIVSNDFEIAGGDGYTMLGGLPPIAEGGLLDKVLQEYIKTHMVNGVFTYAHTSGRILVKQLIEQQGTERIGITPNIQLTPNTKVDVLVDGTKTFHVTTDAEGYFTVRGVSIGMHTITVGGKSYYTSTFTNLGIKEVQKNIAYTRVSKVKDATYSGEEITPEIIVMDGTKVLTEGVDYIVTYKNHVNAGSAVIQIDGIGDYVGTKEVPFTIKAKSIREVTISSISDEVYTGSAFTPSITLHDGDKALVRNKDYKVEYTNNANAGVAKVKIIGLGNYTQTRTITFRIGAKSIQGVTVTIKDQVYTGSKTTPGVVVKDGAKTLHNEKDYLLVFSEKTQAGYATVTLIGIGNYTGTKAVTYQIAPVSIGKATVKSITNQICTGKAIKPSPRITYAGKTLVLGADYTIAYKNNTSVGTATLIIKGKGNYTGTKTVTFRIVPGKARVESLGSTKAKTVTITVGKVAGASKYEFSYKTSKNGTFKVAGTTKKTSYTIRKLTSKKTVYVRVRAYKEVNGKKVYGSYSTVKSVKVK